MKKNVIGAVIIASAIIWGLVIVGCSLKLSGTGCYDKISTILFGGVITHFILIYVPLALNFKKKNKEE